MITSKNILLSAFAPAVDKVRKGIKILKFNKGDKFELLLKSEGKNLAYYPYIFVVMASHTLHEFDSTSKFLHFFL